MNARLSGWTILGLPTKHGGVVVSDGDRVLIGPSILVGPPGSAVTHSRLFPHDQRPHADLDPPGTSELIGGFLNEGYLNGLQAEAAIDAWTPLKGGNAKDDPEERFRKQLKKEGWLFWGRVEHLDSLGYRDIIWGVAPGRTKREKELGVIRASVFGSRHSLSKGMKTVATFYPATGDCLSRVQTNTVHRYDDELEAIVWMWEARGNDLGRWGLFPLSVQDFDEVRA